MPPTTTKYPFEPDNYPDDHTQHIKNYLRDKEDTETATTTTTDTGTGITFEEFSEQQAEAHENYFREKEMFRIVRESEDKMKSIQFNVSFQTLLMVILLIILIFKI